MRSQRLDPVSLRNRKRSEEQVTFYRQTNDLLRILNYITTYAR
jgi:hypothetical protein